MAINLAGLLGGLGVGAQQLASQQEQQRQSDSAKRLQEQQLAETKAQNLRNYNLALQKDEREDARLLEAEARQTYTILNNYAIQDRDDEAQTLTELTTYGKTPEEKQFLIDQRKARHEYRRKAIEDLGSLPEVVKRFPDVTRLLAPSKIAAEGFIAPSAMIPFNQQLAAIESATKAVGALSPAARPGDVARRRAELAQLGIPQSTLDASFPMMGQPKNIGEATTRSRAPLESELLTGPVDLERVNQIRREFGEPSIVNQGGVFVVPSSVESTQTPGISARVTRQFDPATGQVRLTEQQQYMPTYEPPEAEATRRGIQQQQLEFLRRTMDPRVAKEFWNSRLARANALLKDKELEWFDRKADAEIKAMWRRGTKGASSGLAEIAGDLKAFAAESLAASRFGSLGVSIANLDIQNERLRQGRIQSMERRLDGVAAQIKEAKVAAAKARDMGLAGTHKAGMDAVDELVRQESELRKQLDLVRSGNADAINSGFFSGAITDLNQTPTSGLPSAAQMLQQATSRTGQIVQGGVQGFRSGQQGGGINFNPQFNLGGQQAGAAGGVAPGALPWPLGGGGGPQFGDPALSKGITPERMAQVRNAFPGIPDSKLQQYLTADGQVTPQGRLILPKLAKQIKDKQKATPVDIGGDGLSLRLSAEDAAKLRQRRKSGSKESATKPSAGKQLPAKDKTVLPEVTL